MSSTINGANSKIAQANISRSSGDISSIVSNLSSGTKTDANVADFSVGTVLSTKVSTLKTATLNAGQAKSLLETAKGGLDTIADLLTQQKNLATKASDDSLSDNERGFLNQEFQALTKEIDRISSNTNFNGKNLLDGSISGVATGVTATKESTENFTLSSTDQFRLAGIVGNGALDNTTTNDVAGGSFDGVTLDTFAAIDATDIGVTRAELTIAISGDAGDDGAAAAGQISIGGSDVNFTYDGQGDAAADALAFVTAAVTALNESTDANVRSFNFEAEGSSIKVTAKDAGTSVNALTFEATVAGAAGAATVGGTSIESSATAISALAAEPGVTVGANRDSGLTNTYDANLQGGISNISASVSQDGGIKRAIFTADVNGVTYTSNAVSLRDDGNDTFVDGGQKITFSNSNGSRDTDGNLTDNGFELVIGSADVNVAGSSATLTEAQNGLNRLASDIEAQLADTSIVQERSIAVEEVSTTDNTLSGALGTSLEGLKGYKEDGNLQGAVRIRGDSFGSDGSFGSIGAFSYDKDTAQLSTTIDGVTYTADLRETGDGTSGTLNEGKGLIDNNGGSSISTAGVLTIQTADTVAIVLHSETEGDGNQIIIELSNDAVANGDVGNGVNDYTINLGTDAGSSAFEATLNGLFGVAENGSLSFQVGTEATDFIGVSIKGAGTADLYKDDDGTYQAIDISTLEGAQTAGNVLDNAINNVISLISDTAAAISSFDSAIANNEASIQNADSARSVLLDTDYSTESTRYAEATVKFDAASSVLAQANGRIQSLLDLLNF